MSKEITQEIIGSFLAKILAIEKEYAHELQSNKADRRSDIRDVVDQIAGEDLENEA
jgi:hypothetical protein